MNLKTINEIYALEAFADYRGSSIEHLFIYIKALEQYALVTHSGVLFDDYKFIEDIDIFNSTEADLQKYINYIEDNLGSLEVFTKVQAIHSQELSKNRCNEKVDANEVISSNKFFRRYRRTKSKLFWSEKLEKYYLATEKGIMFDDGIFYPTEECIDLQKTKPNVKMLQAIHAAKYEFGWNEIKFID